MNYPSITIQGSIISGEIIAQIRSEQQKFQSGKDFGFDNNQQLKDEIVLAWSDLKNQWNIFASKRSRLKEEESGASETRTFWMDPFFANLGYKLEKANAEIVEGGKPFSINRRDFERDGFPVFIGAWNEKLDKKPPTLRMSPHALVQEYLNVSEHLYALVTNGRQLRLLRDATLLSRTSCVEFNLEKIFEEDLFADFSILYRLLHSTRMPKSKDTASECIIEHYHSESLASGSRIRDNLSKAVKEAIKLLGNGFLKHPKNIAFRESVKKGEINGQLFYHHQLRIIYRLLFLFVIEEKNLVFAGGNTPETKRQSDIYRNYYSLYRLRKLAGRLHLPDMRNHYDLWYSMLSTFSFYENTATGKKLGIMALNGELFGNHTLSCSHYNLKELYLDNSTLLNVMRNLCYFENEQKLLIPVNYRDLDVEEFGSVYEGLLELEPTFDTNTEQLQFYFTESSERSKSGSHYTPEELVQPLIKHSLEYIIEDKLKEKDKETALLSIKVCDVACGSGHILLSAARRIALELAKIRSGEEQPNLDALRKAMRDVIRHCIYGVDKNPLAVELCKVALWLEAHNPGEPLNFLDHHIKNGDAIVGLAHREELEKGIASEAFKALSEEEKETHYDAEELSIGRQTTFAAKFAKKNNKERKEREANATQIKADYENSTTTTVQEAMSEYKTFVSLPENSPEEITAKQKAYNKFLDGKGYNFLKAMADTQVAQFFIPKNYENQERLMTDGEFRTIMKGFGGWQNPKTAMASAVAAEKHFFHWFLEFPEVFQNGGFDCILGNPPFLGGQKLSGTFGDNFLECIKYEFAPIGAVDLVTYFFRRIFTLIKQGGFQSLISTNTIAQGKAREDGLDIIVQQGGSINHAVKSLRWPGQAAVVVALVTITKQNWKRKFILDSKEVKSITPYLDDTETLGNPLPLKKNENKSFQGSIILGKGFVLEPKEAELLITKNIKNKEVLFPYLNGEDLNNSPEQIPSRWVINFFDWTEEKAKQYPDCYEIIERLVKPDRQRKDENGDYVLRKPLPEKWWIYGEKRPALYGTISSLKRILVIAQVSKTSAFVFTDSLKVLDAKLNVFALDKSFYFAILQSNLHIHWAWRFSSTMKTDLSYAPSMVFEPFPFPQNLSSSREQELEQIGEQYHEHRRQLMLLMQLGLTKTYNLFHAQFLTSADVEKTSKQSREVAEKAQVDLFKLRELHKQMDEAVLAAYGWQDVALKHNFYEVDYLPENDRVRYTIHPEARKEVLKRLLELNHTIYEEEIKQGLHKEEDVRKFYEQKGVPIPQEVIAIMGASKKQAKVKAYKKAKNNSSTVNEEESVYQQPKLFEEKNLFNGEGE